METKWLNDRASQLKAGAIRSMFDKAAKIPDVVSLGIGEPDMETPKPICDAGAQALTEGFTHYSANAGLLEFRQAVANSELIPRTDYDPSCEILSTVGGMGGLSLCLNCIVSPGDEVIIPDPAWLNYAAQIRFAQGIPVPAKTCSANGFHLTAEAIEEAITPKTKAVLINSPCNPTGAVLALSDLEGIAEVAKKYDLLVISDEVYCTLIYDDCKHISIASLPGMKERTLVVNSFSKSFAMTGWRVGFSAGPSHLVEKMTRLQENVNACVPVVSQKAAVYALSRMDLAEEMRKIYLQRRNHIVDGLNRIHGITCSAPEGTFYVFADITALGIPSDELCYKLLEDAHVVVTPGNSFGYAGKGFVRFSFANSIPIIDESLNRIEMYLNKLFKNGEGC